MFIEGSGVERTRLSAFQLPTKDWRRKLACRKHETRRTKNAGTANKFLTSAYRVNQVR
jgi:hypothetical protein